MNHALRRDGLGTRWLVLIFQAHTVDTRQIIVDSSDVSALLAEMVIVKVITVTIIECENARLIDVVDQAVV